jgi:hypothetical protein
LAAAAHLFPTLSEHTREAEEHGMEQKEREILEQIFIEMVALENILPESAEHFELRARFESLKEAIKRLAEAGPGPEELIRD